MVLVLMVIQQMTSKHGKQQLHTFANPEEVTINLFATPAINWSDQNILVQDTIEMIETTKN